MFSWRTHLKHSFCVFLFLSSLFRVLIHICVKFDIRSLLLASICLLLFKCRYVLKSKYVLNVNADAIFTDFVWFLFNYSTIPSLLSSIILLASKIQDLLCNNSFSSKAINLDHSQNRFHDNIFTHLDLKLSNTRSFTNVSN